MTEKKEKLYLSILGFLSLVLFIGIFAVEYKLGFKIGEIFIETPFTSANIIINVDREMGQMPQIWRGLAQGGEEQTETMLKPTVGLMKKIGTSYIRLDHIYDDDYYGVVKGKNGDGSLNLDWSKLDSAVGNILASGARPFLSLTYMPSSIASAKINAPENWGDWQNLVRATVQRYSSKTNDVYYEVWNEPSLPMFGSWKMYGDKDYRKLYYFAVKGAQQVSNVNPFKIGGPAIPELDPVWVKLLFDYCLQNNLRLDFISWHRYSFDPERFVQDVYEINVLTDDEKYSQFSKVEKIITEWGPNSYKDKVYSSPVAASHMIAVVRRLLDKITLAFAFEIKDGPGQGKEGWGILTHESAGMKTKPRYALFSWLHDFDGKRVEVLGEGSQITGFAVKKENEVLALLTNYAPSGNQEESFQITFAGINPGKYRLVNKQLFGDQDEKELDVKDKSLVFSVTLKPYSVAQLILTKIGDVEISISTPQTSKSASESAQPTEPSPIPLVSPVERTMTENEVLPGGF